eukprot:s1257_g3.t3
MVIPRRGDPGCARPSQQPALALPLRAHGPHPPPQCLFGLSRPSMKQGWWKEEYFLTRDAAHAQALKIKLHVRFRALLCSAAHAIRAQEGLSWLSKLWGVQCVRTSAADRLCLTELDVQFMLLHMYQVTFATEDSAWTRKRNADFLALQLKVQQAITTAYSEFVSRPSVCRRFCVLWAHLQPHISVQSYSLVTRCSLRACVVVANIFGRVALSVVYFLVIADSRARITADSCASAGERQYVDDVARGIFLQILFSCISRMLLLLWTAGMMLFHSREFKQDQEWDTESRRQQVVRWWIRDGVFAALILLYSVLCCTFGAAYIASASDEDGQRWLTSFATMVLLTALGEPLVKSLLCAVVAGASIKEDGGLRLQDCLAPELGAGPQKTGLSAITEVDEAPSPPPPDTGLPIAQRADWAETVGQAGQLNEAMARNLLPIPDVLQQTGEDPVEYRNAEPEWTKIPGTTKAMQIQRQQIVLREEDEAEAKEVDSSEGQLMAVGPKDEGSAEEAGHGDEQILESSTKRAHEVAHVLQQAATYENIPALRHFSAVAGSLLGAKLQDQRNIVQGAARSLLSKKQRKALEALDVFAGYTQPELELWRRRRQALRVQRVHDTFDSAHRDVIRSMFHVWHMRGIFRIYANAYGPYCDADAVWESLNQIFEGKITKRPAGNSSSLFFHLALVMLIHDQQHERHEKSCAGSISWGLACQAMAAVVFAACYDAEVSAGQEVTIESGLPVDVRRDDELFLLHFFFEPSGPARVRLLTDVRNWSNAVQVKKVEPLISFPGLCPLRCFHITQDVYEPSQVEVQKAAFLSFKGVMQMSSEELAKEWLQGQATTAGTVNLPTTDAMAKWVASLASQGRRLLLAQWNLGLRHPEYAYAMAKNQLRITNPAHIQAVLDAWKSHAAEGILPLTLDPPECAMDWALEGFFWGREDITLEEEAVLILAGCDEEQLAEVAVERPDLAWLLDPSLRREQEDRAAQVCREWVQQGFPRNSARRPGDKDIKSQKPHPQEPEIDAGPLRLPVRDVLETLAKKRVKFRHPLKSLSMLQRLGYMGQGDAGARVLTHGSHIVFHGPGGAATYVRDHKGTAPLSSSAFLSKMEEIAEVCGGGG